MRLTHSRYQLILIMVIPLSIGSPTFAAEPDDARIWASQCFQCHGTNGNAVGDVDEIGGESAKSTFEKLMEMKYRGKTEGIMDLHARGYSDDQLRRISNYISRLGGNDDD